MADSGDLIQRMLRSERSSFEEIVKLYAEDVLRQCCLLLGDRDEAQDVLQEAMLRLVHLVKAGKFRTANGSIKGFLMTASRNLCLDRLKKRVDFRSLDEDWVLAQAELSTTLSPDRAMDAARFESAFDKALTELTAAQRAVLVMHELNGESQSEIAATLGLHVECVRTHLYRARRKMRLLLARFAGEL